MVNFCCLSECIYMVGGKQKICRVGYQSFIYIANNKFNLNMNCVIFVIFVFGKGSQDE